MVHRSDYFYYIWYHGGTESLLQLNQIIMKHPAVQECQQSYKVSVSFLSRVKTETKIVLGLKQQTKKQFLQLLQYEFYVVCQLHMSRSSSGSSSESGISSSESRKYIISPLPDATLVGTFSTSEAFTPSFSSVRDLRPS